MKYETNNEDLDQNKDQNIGDPTVENEPSSLIITTWKDNFVIINCSSSSSRSNHGSDSTYTASIADIEIKKTTLIKRILVRK